jgi:glutamate-1-semialdehyde aminotransferase
LFEANDSDKHRASIAYREVAERTIAGAVASRSWRASPPHAICVDHRQGNRLWDIDGGKCLDTT